MAVLRLTTSLEWVGGSNGSPLGFPARQSEATYLSSGGVPVRRCSGEACASADWNGHVRQHQIRYVIH